MVTRLIEWALANRLFVVLLVTILVVGGLFAMNRLPIDAVPDVTNVQVQIVTASPALGPVEVELTWADGATERRTWGGEERWVRWRLEGSERLAQVERFEAALRAIGFGQLRVRYHGPVARIELDVAELQRAAEPGCRERIVEAGREAGFKYVTIDLGGYRMGSHNEMLVGRSLPLIQ